MRLHRWVAYSLPGDSAFGWLVTLGSHAFGRLGVALVVSGKARGRVLFHPDELRRGHRLTVHRTHLYCFKYFDTHELERPPARKVKHENIDSQLAHRHCRGPLPRGHGD